MRRILIISMMSFLFGASGGAQAKDAMIVAPPSAKRIREKIEILHKQSISNGELFTLEKIKAQKQFQIIML